MRAVILAAGTGSRLGARTAAMPKCLVELAGRPLLEWQLQALRKAGVTEIAAATGAHAEQLEPFGLTTFHNPRFATTNMVASLMGARSWFDGGDDVIIVYGDIVYQADVVTALVKSDEPLNVVVDRNWRALWQLRMDDPLADAETLRIDDDGLLTELGGKPTDYSQIEAQYIGMIKVAAAFATEFVAIHDALDPDGPYDGRTRDTMYMTSLLQHCIDLGVRTAAVTITGGWLEVDTNDDIAAYEAQLATNSLTPYLDTTRI